MGRKRSDYIEVTNEHRAFKQMMEEKKRKNPKFSYRYAGELLGKSDSYISQLANGRADFPRGEELEKFLTILFGIKVKSFNERVRLYKEKITLRGELIELVEKLSDEKNSLILKFAKSVAQ